MRALVRVVAVGDDKKQHLASGKLLGYFSDDSSAMHLKHKDMLVTKFNWRQLPAPSSTEEFNFRKFMERRQVYGKLNIRSFRLLTTKEQFSIPGWAFRCRAGLLEILKKGLSGQEYAVAAALLIGEDDFVDKKLMQAFTSTGTLHVLSVSGMHVGLIYMLLALVLGKMEKRKGWRVLYFFLLYGFLWGYALITGFSAPVVRSAMMLSLVLSGKLLQRKSPVLNTLTGSFLLLMMYNPYWLTETGFQLSYLAVFGIMTLHPLLLVQFEFQHLWVHRIWELVSVSLCAQLITVPVGLLYFGQFPNYFLISNLIIIPISTLAIYGGILAIVSAAIPYAGNLVSLWESYLLKLLNALTIFLGNLPGAVLYTGKISILNCILLYLILFAAVAWLQTRATGKLIRLLWILIAWSFVVLFRL